MTGARGLGNANFRKPSRKNLHDSVSNSRVHVSVGFETASRYPRRKNTQNQANPVFARTKSASKAKYIAPSAEVVLMPGTVERAAIDELLSAELPSLQKDRISIKDKIKSAAHRSSEAYTMYGVETAEIFTEEFEINVSDGAAFRGDRKNQNFNLSSKQEANAASILKAVRSSVENHFRSFALKLNKLSSHKDDQAG